jgi:hypothetical protein
MTYLKLFIGPADLIGAENDSRRTERLKFVHDEFGRLCEYHIFRIDDQGDCFRIVSIMCEMFT